MLLQLQMSGTRLFELGLFCWTGLAWFSLVCEWFHIKKYIFLCADFWSKKLKVIVIWKLKLLLTDFPPRIIESFWNFFFKHRNFESLQKGELSDHVL